MRFLLLLLLAPLLEIWLLIYVGSHLGAGPTIALVVLAAVLGVALIRRVGLSTLTRANQRIRAGEVPAQEMGEGLVLVIAGLLLILPGFATDAVGLIFLLPFVRRRLLAPWVRMQKRTYAGRSDPSRTGTTLEGEYRREDDERLKRDHDADREG